MARCEDYPCCGHEAGDCPDASGRMKCIECGKRLSKNAHSSICTKCLRRNYSSSYEDSYESMSDY